MNYWSVDFTTSTSLEATPDNKVTIGETITYTATITFPEGTTPDNYDVVSLVKFEFPTPQLEYVSSNIIFGNNVISNSYSNNDEGTISMGVFKSIVSYNLGIVVNSGDNLNDNDDKITISVIFVVADVSQNEASALITPLNAIFNDVYNVKYIDKSEYSIVEPVLAHVTATPLTGLDAGDIIIYEVELNHVNGVSNSTAYDLLFIDMIHTKMSLIPSSDILVDASSNSVIEVGSDP